MTESENRVGQQLGDYHLLRLLGKGGFAEVYLGEHVNRKSLAAVKVLHARIAKDNIKGFLNEARSIRLKHPNIIPILDFGLEDEYPYLVMDYAPNGSLRQRHRKGSRLPGNIIVTYVKQVAGALQYAHDDKVIHRDIKPENMLVGKHNEILLADFGIATIAQSSRYQSPQDMAGTISYMSPEQIQGKPRPASDQYSLGVVIYEWITGKRPFSGSLSELIGQHISTSPSPLRDAIASLPPTVEEVVMKSLAKDPKERFASIVEFSLALEEAWREAPPQPPQIISVPPPPGQQLQTRVIPQAELQSAAPVPQAGKIYPAQQTKGADISTALAQFEAGRYSEALATLETILTYDPTFHQALNSKGLVLYHLKRYPEALIALDNAIVHNASDASAHYGKVLTLEKIQRYPEALEALEQVIKLYPTYVSAWCKKGSILSRMMRYEASLAAYEQALKLDPNNADAYIGKGSALKLLGRTR